MEIERGVDLFANRLREVRQFAVDGGVGSLYDGHIWDALLFAVDDLQRQIDELKEERR